MKIDKFQLFFGRFSNRLKEEIQVNLTDLAVILSNSLDNAIEAAAQVKKEDEN